MPSADALGNHTLTSIHRPQMPTFEDEQRAIHQAVRFGILLDEWDEVESEWLEEHIGAERSQVWGIPDTSANPLADLSRQLSTPGLYGIRPDFRRTQGGADDLIGIDGHMERAGFYTKQQFVQYLVLGLSDMFVRFDINTRKELVVKLVAPHNVYLQAPSDDPANPTQLWELGRRFLDIEKQWVFVWEVWDLGAVNLDGEVVRPPSYGIFEANAGMSGLRTPTGSMTQKGFQGGSLGRDLTHRFVSTPDGEQGGQLTGDNYPWKTANGTPVFPHVHYQDADTGMLWNTFLKRGIHKGTLNTGLFWTYAGHCARDATGSYVMVAGLEVGSHQVLPIQGGVDGRGGQNWKPGIGISTKLITPGAIEFLNIKEGETPFVHEVGPGANLEMVTDFADRYEMKQAVRWGLNPTDLARTAANPTSAAALMVGNQGKRDFSAQVTAIFRRKDLQSILNASVVLRAAGVANYPEGGYSTQYFVIPRSAAEQKEHREDLTWKEDRGQMSQIDTYRELNPGTTEADALAALVTIAVQNATLQAAIDDALTATEGVDVAAGSGGGDAAQDSALNGAQIAQLVSIVTSMNAGEITEDQAASIVARSFLISLTAAAELVGDPTPPEAPPIEAPAAEE